MLRDITPPSGEVITVLIDEVDLQNRVVHAKDRHGGRLAITFKASGAFTQIPTIGEYWTASRVGFNWFLQTRMDTAEEHDALSNLTQGDLRITTSADMHLNLGGYLYFNGGPMGYPSQYVYNSSGTQVGNRYNNWQDLQDALTLFEGRKFIQFEQDETLPVGSYDHSGQCWHGNGIGAHQFFVYLQDGYTVTSWDMGCVDDQLNIQSQSSSPIWSVPDGAAASFRVNIGSLASTSAPFISVGNDAFVQIAMTAGGVFYDSGYEVVDVQGSGVVVVALVGGLSYIQNDTIRGDGVFLNVIANAAIPTGSGDIQTNFTGTLQELVGTTASSIGYENTDSGLTADRVQSAIDEIAAGLELKREKVTPHARVSLAGAASHTSTGNWQEVTWDTEVSDNSAMFAASSTDITVPNNGIYIIEASVTFASDAIGTRGCRILVNGSPIRVNEGQAQASSNTRSAQVTASLSEDDVITVEAYQDSGGNLSYEVSSGMTGCSVVAVGTYS